MLEVPTIPIILLKHDQTRFGLSFPKGRCPLGVRHSCHPCVSGSPQERTFGQCRVYEYMLAVPGSSFFPQQRLQRTAQQPAQGGGDSLPVAGLAVLEPAKALH
jgi:hypothetical protein